MIRLSNLCAANFALALLAAGLPHTASAVDVRICTDRGVIEITLDEQAAPGQARNFARYAEDGFYSGTIFHRVVPGSMVQGGAYTPALERREARRPIANEARNALSNLRGTIAASRSGDTGTASAQYFINLSDNAHLDPAPGFAGYTVFGRVTAGLDVLDAISRQPTRRAGDLTDVPLTPVELTSVTTLARERFFGLSVEPDPGRLRSDFESASNSGGAAATLAAIDALRRACVALDSRMFLAEAEAATELGRNDRARYSLEQYLAGANRNDPLLPRLQRLYTGLPQPGRSNVEDRISHCRRPISPSIPQVGEANLGTLQLIERLMRSYQQSGRIYLNCVSQVIDNGTLNEQEVADATALHNEVVVELTAVTAHFNAVARAFKETND